MRMLEVLRYARGASQVDATIDGYPNFHFATSSHLSGSQPKLMLERGINPSALVAGPGDEHRRPVILIRSSPWKAGQASNPWHDEFDLDHGYVRYYGDHKPDTAGLPGTTAGNRAMREAWELHASIGQPRRAASPPLLLFRSATVVQHGRRLVKGHVEFCGVAIIERLEHVVQRDPVSGRGFPNLAFDLVVLDLADSGERLDMRWIADRRNPALSLAETERHAPASWRRWAAEGKAGIPRLRRRVVSSRIKSTADQSPPPGSEAERALAEIHSYFSDRSHTFELLAAKVAARVLGGTGAIYREGWLTRSGRDGGMDFVGRLDVGSPESNTPLVVLGQAKCVAPGTSISPDQVARVVARLRRGWIGVFVTTGVFSRQAQAEVVDDEYPLVLVGGRVLAEQVIQLAAESYDADLAALLCTIAGSYAGAVTHRRPEEILVG
ncbi:restriction endonuclease [Natronosporangium hydrolyticum]|uniref:Restriction endonuclease n=1 Tax=Natronosporangium hydrolyticum TaxID=2811111 RepID=A0A895YPM5_9ACTN|nr:restriction endonuclease [Natronosporangium hydrolyticum]